MSRTAPEKMGPYRLSKRVYAGHATEIWQAYDDRARRSAAVKILTPAFRNDRDRIGQMKWEYRVGANLAHPSVVRTYGFAKERDTAYLAVEWFPAPNMKHWINSGLDPIAHLLPRIVVRATEGLAYFSGEGWIHRDVKPENFLVNQEGEVKLIDFNLAQPRRGFWGRLLAGKSKVQGTQSYMSPEQIRCLALDERADLYGLACAFFHLLAGKPPFTGGSTQELLTKHLRSPIPSLEAANPKVTPAFSGLIKQAMAKNAADRPDSVAYFLAQLREIPVVRGE